MGASITASPVHPCEEAAKQPNNVTLPLYVQLLLYCLYNCVCVNIEFALH